MSKLIVGNWKLNPLTAQEAIALASKLQVVSRHAVVVCPPTPFISLVKYPYLGAQDCSAQIKGAYTGQVSPAELASLGVSYCIVGHSERRAMGETDQDVCEKITALLNYKITPILCVGFGTKFEQDELEVMDVLKAQIAQSIGDNDPGKIVVAYEPVWAIGSKHAATPDHAEKVGLYIKMKHRVRQALYGGSVNSTNASGFLEQPHVDGLLIGGSSLLPDDFNKIISL
ncbi:MAG: triose-phosphate isomerase [bacterium]|nr:triose-phosphate isomerase [bacterium]